MDIIKEIEETKLILKSILAMSNETHRENLLYEFIKYFRANIQCDFAPDAYNDVFA